MTRAVRLTAWLFLAATVLAGAPRAWAHGVAPHRLAPHDAAPETGARHSLAIHADLAAPCSGPGAPVHACGCGNLSLCEPSTKPALVHAHCVLAVVPKRPSHAPCAIAAPARTALTRAAHRPRAPPFLA